MSAAPSATAVTSPDMLTVATVGFDEFQEAAVVWGARVPSVRVAMTVSCAVAPMPLSTELPSMTMFDRPAGVGPVGEPPEQRSMRVRGRR